MRVIHAVIKALNTFTRVNIRIKNKDEADGQLFLINLITAGLLTGFLWALIYQLLIKISAPVIITAALISAFPLWFTRYIHLEGFADTSSDILSIKGGYDREKNKIYGFISISVMLILSFAGAYTFVENMGSPLLLFFLPILSRELAVISVFLFPALPDEEAKYYHSSVKMDYVVILLILLIATIILPLTICGISGSALVFGASVSFILATVHVRKALGLSGDSTGYGITISEVFGMLILGISYDFISKLTF